jgi:hypothetical protein
MENGRELLLNLESRKAGKGNPARADLFLLSVFQIQRSSTH